HRESPSDPPPPEIPGPPTPAPPALSRPPVGPAMTRPPGCQPGQHPAAGKGALGLTGSTPGRATERPARVGRGVDRLDYRHGRLAEGLGSCEAPERVRGWL